jgi:hypothetical protein
MRIIAAVAHMYKNTDGNFRLVQRVAEVSHVSEIKKLIDKQKEDIKHVGAYPLEGICTTINIE